MKSFNYTIIDPVGIHARPAGVLVKEAKKYASAVSVVKGDKKADAKKLMVLMGLGVKCGDEVTVEVDGADEDTAVTALEAFFKENDKAEVYMQDTSAENCYLRTETGDKYIGIPVQLLEAYKERFHTLHTVCEVEKGVWAVPHSTENLDGMGRRVHMYRKVGDEFIADDFAHEQSIVFETEKGLVIFNSCSHGGIANIVREVQNAFAGKKIYAVIGGFHMMKLSGLDTLGIPLDEVVKVARELKELGVEKVYTGHCTGMIAFGIMKRELGNMVHALNTGCRIEI